MLSHLAGSCVFHLNWLRRWGVPIHRRHQALATPTEKTSSQLHPMGSTIETMVLSDTDAIEQMRARIPSKISTTEIQEPQSGKQELSC